MPKYPQPAQPHSKMLHNRRPAQPVLLWMIRHEPQACCEGLEDFPMGQTLLSKDGFEPSLRLKSKSLICSSLT